MLSGGDSAPAAVLRLPLPDRAAGRRPGAGLTAAIAVIVAAGLALSPLAHGYFDMSAWGPLALGAIVLMITLALIVRPKLTRAGLVACAGLAGMLAMSAASMLWSESKEAAWTSTNRLALYCVIFMVGALAVRRRETGRAVILILGAPALIASVVLCLDFLFGGGSGAFLLRRLNSPIGYINGSAGLFTMGLWPWLACAESLKRPVLRACSLTAASLIACTAVLTQSRAIVPATVATVVVLLAAAPGRTRRAVNLMIVGVAIALSLHWTLAVYSYGGAAARALSPGSGLLRPAAGAILVASLLAGAVKLGVTALAQRAGEERRRRLEPRLGRVMLVAAVLAVAAIAVAGHTTISNQYHAFVDNRVNENAGNRFLDAGGFRADLWRVGLKEFSQEPLHGLGAGNYDKEYYQLRRNPQYVLQPHSLEIQYAAELGILGLLALLAFVGAVLAGGIARRGSLASRDRLITVGALGIFISWLAATSVDWLYDIPGLAGMAFLAAALLLSSEAPETTAPARRRGPALAGLIGGLAVLALLAASIGRQYAASRYESSGQAKAASAPVAAIGTLRTSLQLDPYSLQTLYGLASAYASLDDYADARATLQAAARREPDNYVPPALLGDLATRRGDLRVAVREYGQAVLRNPFDPSLRQSLEQAQAALR